MTTYANQWTCVNRDGKVWKLDPTRSMDTQDAPELPSGYYVPITGERGVVDVYAGDFRHRYSSVPELQSTGYYAEYPYPEIDPECQVILHTNKLAVSECPLPHQCGPATFTEVDSQWWGDEHGLCSTAGAHHHDISPSDIPKHPGWALVLTMKVGINDDLCNAAALFNVLRFPNGTELAVHRLSLANRPLYNIETGKYAVLYLHLDRRLGQDTRCVVVPSQNWATPYGKWNPPFLARRARFEYTGIEFTPLEDVNLTTVIIRGDWGDNLRPIRFHSPPDQPPECLNIRYVTKYSVPGSTIIPVVLEHILDFAVRVLDMIAVGILPFVFRVFNDLDMRYRFTEVIAVLLLSLWWTDRAQHAFVVTTAYALLTGLRR